MLLFEKISRKMRKCQLQLGTLILLKSVEHM